MPPVCWALVSAGYLPPKARPCHADIFNEMRRLHLKSPVLVSFLLLPGICVFAQPSILNAASYAQQGMPNSAIAGA
jgi:hypothetical protein